MISKLKDKLVQLLSDMTVETEDPVSLSTEHAVCVLLIEIMRADHQINDAERKRIRQLLQSKFSLSDSDTEWLIEQGQSTSDLAIDLFQFTRQINEHCTIDKKIEIVGWLWQIAQADGAIADEESHRIRQIADLLHLRHHEYIKAKQSITN